MVPKVGGIYESNQICQGSFLKQIFPTRKQPNRGEPPRLIPADEKASAAMGELRHSLENLDSLFQTAGAAFGPKIGEFQETKSEAEVQQEIQTTIAELSQKKSKSNKSMLQRMAKSFDLGAWKHKPAKGEFEKSKKDLMALEMRLMGKAAAMEMLWDAGIQLLDEMARVFESDASEPFVVLLGLLMSHIRTISGKRKRTSRTPRGEDCAAALEPVLSGLMSMASSASPATMQHQLVLMSLELFGSGTTKRPFIASLRGQSSRAEENLKLLVKNGVEQQHELTLLRGAELLHSCTKATMHDAVTLPEVEQLLQLVRRIAETPSTVAAQVLLDQVRKIHEKPRYGASSAQGSPAPSPRVEIVSTPATPVMGADAEEASERSTLMHKYFIRFDLDGCGKLSSRDDLRMLCTSLCVKLEIGVSPERIGELVDQSADASQYTLPEFESWFSTVFHDANLTASRSTPRSTPRSPSSGK